MGEHTLTRPNLLGLAIRSTATTWPPLSGPGDPNTIDLYWQAANVSERMGVTIPHGIPPKATLLEIVRCVEDTFVRGSLIRNLPTNVLSDRGLLLVRTLRSGQLWAYLPEQIYVIALYAWHGCINMAKITRRTYVTGNGEAPYPTEVRISGYRSIRRCWTEEVRKGNPWVRYGVSVARALENGRGNELIDDWVPRNSPYWES